MTAISFREEERVRGLKILEGKLFAAGVLELFVKVAARKMNLEDVG